ncbi:hypothetical protein MJO28_014634 [Puccinia striiformis f. sp. tritici]|uniref:Uncharacterized protein n=1 Tax=Puccinia striiformis f. sp. tritici TaxID=168172 RepID=A0ACC0DUH0_9BASI|nr:hypothetical protein MJO28_014634 [Puccinia striiformis f. sp. tritici]
MSWEQRTPSVAGFLPASQPNHGSTARDLSGCAHKEEGSKRAPNYRPKEETSSGKASSRKTVPRRTLTDTQSVDHQVINHACARVTLHKFGYDTLIDWLVIHVENCKQLCQKSGFMTAL